MASTKCINANAQLLNHATIAQAGAVATGGLTGSVALSTLKKMSAENPKVYKAVSAASSGNIGTGLAYGSGTFASFQKNQYVMMVAGRHISGVSTTRFMSPVSRINVRADNRTTTVHTSYLTGFSWSGATFTFTKTASNPSYGTDNGLLNAQIVYRTGKPLPVQANLTVPYSA